MYKTSKHFVLKLKSKEKIYWKRKIAKWKQVYVMPLKLYDKALMKNALIVAYVAYALWINVFWMEQMCGQCLRKTRNSILGFLYNIMINKVKL